MLAVLASDGSLTEGGRTMAVTMAVWWRCARSKQRGNTVVTTAPEIVP
jgi:hypothetical protein